ncbi:WXG100 family type VII secretion target [Nocardia blacklockiae]|uniref:WXG100 family type VII secretion target n=1 Tax=Nocardia blacklockiae TaxID=480036 RepID=UPI00189427E7|nr:WXG100 family type VII secretion target [Nocardia blacklockiae]MBF6174736.1 WXG100 family type VII secretion target [Nocardia blacklockiae]
MNDSLSVDPAELRASAADLTRQADETQQMLEEMKAIIADEGRCWGDDELGETFAESYESDSENALAGLEDLVAELRSMSAAMLESADEFENQDRDAGRHLRDVNPFDRSSAAAPTPDLSANTAQQPAPSENPYTTGDSDRQPIATDGPAAVPNPRPQSSSPPASETGSSPGTDPQRSPQADGSNDPSGTDNPGSESPGTDTPGSESPARQADDRSPEAASGAPPAGGDPARRPVNSPTGKQPSTPPGQAARSPAGQPTADRPLSQNKPSTPWAKPPATPGNETPPRVAPPRAPTRPPGAGKRDKPTRPEPAKRSKQRATLPRSNRPTDAEAMQIVRQLAARHGLSIVGFESAGIDVPTAQDIADAVDTVLARYPAVLRGIEVSDVTSSLSTVEDRRVATKSAPAAPWIVLAGAAAANPRLLADRSRPGHVPDAPPQRPMYTTILRELGSAVDLTGGFRARRSAQRTLITEYLRLHGAQGETLAQVVGGYKRWRAQLGDSCFDNGVFVPARAVAEAFAAVESTDRAASGPEKALHRMVVALSRTPALNTRQARPPTRSGWLPDAPATPPQSSRRPSHRQ